MAEDNLQAVGEQIVESLKQAYEDHFGPKYQIYILLSHKPKYRLIISHTQNSKLIFNSDSSLDKQHEMNTSIQSQSVQEIIENCLSNRMTSEDQEVLHVFSYSEKSAVKFEPVGILSPSQSLEIHPNLHLRLVNNKVDSKEITVEVGGN